MQHVALATLPGRPCPIAASLELVGERWALLVVREIAMGSTRFGDIVAGTGAPRDRIDVRAEELPREERDVKYAEQAALFPGFKGYEEKTDRVIPVVALTPR